MSTFDRIEIIEEIEGLAMSCGQRITVDLTSLTDLALVGMAEAMGISEL